MIEKSRIRTLIQEIEITNQELEYDLTRAYRYLTIYEQIAKVHTYNMNLKLIEKLKRLIGEVV